MLTWQMSRSLAWILLAVAAITRTDAFNGAQFSKTDNAGSCSAGHSLISSEDQCKVAGIRDAATASKTCTWDAAETSTDSNFRGSTDYGARPHGCWKSEGTDGCVYWNPNKDDAVVSAVGLSICAKNCDAFNCSDWAEYVDRSASFARQLANKDGPSKQMVDTHTQAGSFIQAVKGARTSGVITSTTTPIAATNGGYKFETHGTNAAGEACAMLVRTGMKICVPCKTGWSRRGGGNSNCRWGNAMIGLEVSAVESTVDCSRWFLYADAQVRTVATGWRANWISDRIPPLGARYVAAVSGSCGDVEDVCCDED